MGEIEYSKSVIYYPQFLSRAGKLIKPARYEHMTDDEYYRYRMMRYSDYLRKCKDGSENANI
jgi:hypothetical protein